MPTTNEMLDQVSRAVVALRPLHIYCCTTDYPLVYDAVMRLALRLHMPENLVRVRSSEFLQPGTAVVMDGMRPIHVAIPAPEPIGRSWTPGQGA